jgi:hypothetical protein
VNSVCMEFLHPTDFGREAAQFPSSYSRASHVPFLDMLDQNTCECFLQGYSSQQFLAILQPPLSQGLQESRKLENDKCIASF